MANEILVYRKGPALVKLFNKYRAKDVYDDLGLPDIGKKSGHRPSRTEYAKARIQQMNRQSELRYYLIEIFNAFENKEIAIPPVIDLLQKNNYSVDSNGTDFTIHGGTVDRSNPIVNEAHFRDIESRILEALTRAQVSIIVAMGWFTNDTLRDKLLEKQAEGIEVKMYCMMMALIGSTV